jgi:hypothetical protein
MLQAISGSVCYSHQQVKNIIDQLRKNGKIGRNYTLGLKVQTVDVTLHSILN